MGAVSRRIRQVEEGGAEAVRASIRRLDGRRRPQDHQVRRDLHLPEDV